MIALIICIVCVLGLVVACAVGDKPVVVPSPIEPSPMIKSNKFVYSPHDYPESVAHQDWFTDSSYPANLSDVWDKYWGYLARNQEAPILLGEFGTKFETDSDKQWLGAICDYAKFNDLSFAYWSLNPNSGDTGGLLEQDWKTLEDKKLEVLKRAM